MRLDGTITAMLRRTNDAGDMGVIMPSIRSERLHVGHKKSNTPGCGSSRMPTAPGLGGLSRTDTAEIRAAQFQRQPGLSTDNTTFQLIHKRRADMVRLDQDSSSLRH
jgi:hypothetical protein